MKESLGGFISDAGRLLRKRLDAAVRRYNVTGAQGFLLFCVYRNPGITQGQLAERLEVEPITTCRMVDRLVQAGLVERRRDPDDRRAWNIHLTDAALPMIGHVREIGADVMDQAMAGFTRDERDMLADLMERLRANLLDDDAFRTSEVRHG